MKYKVGDKVRLNAGKTGILIKQLYEDTWDIELDNGREHTILDDEIVAIIESTDTQDEKPDNVVCMTEEEAMGDMVNHPKHYTQGEIETIDKIKYLTRGFSGIEAVCLGNFIKYIDRCNLKGGMEDLEKAKWYLNRFLDEFYDEFHDR